MEIVRLAGLKVGQAFLYQRHWMTVADVNLQKACGIGDSMMRDVFDDVFPSVRPTASGFAPIAGVVVCNDITGRSRVTLPGHAYVERCE